MGATKGPQGYTGLQKGRRDILTLLVKQLFYKKQFILFFVHNTHKTIEKVCTKITSKTHIYISFIYYTIYTAQKFSKLSIFASELIIF